MMKSSLKDDGDVHPLDRQFQGLGMDEMEALDAGSLEFSELSNYLNNSKGGTHRVTYQVQDIFRIQRHGEEDRFKKSPYSKIDSDRRLLWYVFLNCKRTYPLIVLQAWLSRHQLRWYSRSRPPHRTAGSSSLRIHVRKGHIPRRHVFQVRRLLFGRQLWRHRSPLALRSRTRKPDARAQRRVLYRWGGREGAWNAQYIWQGPRGPEPMEGCWMP